MSHPMTRCYCNRKLHWPKNVRLGSELRCFRCGEVWAWSLNPQAPAVMVGSLPPPPQPEPVPTALAAPTPAPAPRHAPPRPRPPGCGPLALLLALVPLGSLAAIVWRLVS